MSAPVIQLTENYHFICACVSSFPFFPSFFHLFSFLLTFPPFSTSIFPLQQIPLFSLLSPPLFFSLSSFLLLTLIVMYGSSINITAPSSQLNNFKKKLHNAIENMIQGFNQSHHTTSVLLVVVRVQFMTKVQFITLFFLPFTPFLILSPLSFF